MNSLQSDSFTLDRRDYGQRLQITVKRYTLGNGASSSGGGRTNGQAKGRQPHHYSKDGILLILAHDAGQHKEQWEPFLEDLQILQSDAGDHPQDVITEAWSIDCPNHGEGASVNEDDLFINSAPVGCVDYARSIMCLLESGLLAKSGSIRSVIFGGHGSGATSVTLAAHLLRERNSTRPLPYRVHSLLLLDPLNIKTLSAGSRALDLEIARRSSSAHRSLAELTAQSPERSTWDSETDAAVWLSQRNPWKIWDSRCLNLFVKHGLRSSSAKYLAQLSGDRVELACSPSDSKFVLENGPEHAVASDILQAIRRDTPVHILFGEDSPLCPSDTELGMLYEELKAPDAGSIKVTKAGHSLLQERPTTVARHLLMTVRHQERKDRPSSAFEVQARL